MSNPLIVRCSLSVIPMRREPSDKSEMVNQMLYGENGEVLEQNEKWYLIRLAHDGYEGWVDKKQLSIATTIETKGVTTETWLPGSHHQRLFISPGSFASASPSTLSLADLPQLSLQFIGTPYLWGGRSIWGIDCSGFTQLVYRMVGIALPRDAYQQAEIGQAISFVEETVAGDLAFFDNDEGRIVHVGMVYEKKEGRTFIVHASGEVRIDVLDHQGIFNEEIGAYTHKLRIIRRVKE